MAALKRIKGSISALSAFPPYTRLSARFCEITKGCTRPLKISQLRRSHALSPLYLFFSILFLKTFPIIVSLESIYKTVSLIYRHRLVCRFLAILLRNHFIILEMTEKLGNFRISWIISSLCMMRQFISWLYSNSAIKNNNFSLSSILNWGAR